MKHRAGESTEPLVVPPEDASDLSRRQTEKVGLVITITGGVFGVLAVAGLALLPSSTWGEKFLVLGASLALSLAVFTGIGAWRSARRFAFTASAEGITVICLAALSIVAASKATTPQNGSSLSTPPASQQTTPRPSTEPSTSIPASATSSPRVSSTGTSSQDASASQSLISMTPVSGSTSSFAVGPQTVNGHQYQEVLYDVTQQNDTECGSYNVDEDTFNLDRRYHDFRVTVGVADSAPLGDTVTFTFLLDNQQKGPSPTLPAGETLPIDINVSGVFRITLQDYCSSANSSGNQVVAVWINPVISLAEISMNKIFGSVMDIGLR